MDLPDRLPAEELTPGMTASQPYPLVLRSALFARVSKYEARVSGLMVRDARKSALLTMRVW